MANPNGGPIHSRFQPGQSGNPGGRPKAKITKEKIREIIDKLAMLDRDELQAVIQDKKTTVIELYFASMLAQGMKDGDHTRIQFVLDQAIGKVKDQIEISSMDDASFDKEAARRLSLLKNA